MSGVITLFSRLQQNLDNRLDKKTDSSLRETEVARKEKTATVSQYLSCKMIKDPFRVTKSEVSGLSMRSKSFRKSFV